MKTLIVLLAFVVSFASAQNVEVERVETLLLPEDARYFHPRFSPDGNRLLLTSENYGGLMLYDFSTRELIPISDAPGAGQYPVFSPDGATVYFTRQEISGHNRSHQLMRYRLAVGKSQPVEEEQAAPPQPASIFVRWWQALFPSPGSPNKPLNLQALRAGRWDFPYAVVEKGRLMYYRDTGGVALDPLKARYYLHASLSPDESRILAYAVGKGAFVCNVKGENVKRAGTLEAPVWLAGNIIVGMVTRDDGHTITGSKLEAVDISTGKTIILTQERIVAMYPAVSPNKKIIAAHTLEGKIVLVHYKL